MTEYDISRVAYLGILLLVIGIGFFRSRRHRLNQSLQQAAVWVLIFLGLVTAYGFRDVIQAQMRPQTTFALSENAVVLRRDRDGHFVADLSINGATIPFVVDTGASEIVLTKRDAEKAGIDVDSLRYYGRASTANGSVGTAPVTLQVVKLGPITDYDVRASVNEGDLFGSLLGLSYLNTFSEVRISGDEMFLTR